MTTSPEQIFSAWADFKTLAKSVKRPRTEKEYDRLIELLDILSDLHDCNKEPWASLFDLLAGYVHEYEETQEPLPESQPYQLLAFLMEAKGVSQSDLAKAGIADQPRISKILAGKLAISKQIALKLAQYFGVSVETFIHVAE